MNLTSFSDDNDRLILLNFLAKRALALVNRQRLAEETELSCALFKFFPLWIKQFWLIKIHCDRFGALIERRIW